MKRILLTKDVMELSRASRPSIYRWIRERRHGIGNFPLPISESGRQLRWNADDIEAWFQSGSTPQPTVPVVSPKKQPKVKERQQRKEAVSVALLRHGININPKQSEK